MGTSHRQAPGQGPRRPGPRRASASSSPCPTATRSRSATAARPRSGTPPPLGLVRERALHLTYGEFSSKFAKATAGAPFLADPIVVEAEPGDAPGAGRRPGGRRDRLGAQRDLDRRDGPGRAARRRRRRARPDRRHLGRRRPAASTSRRPTSTTSPRRRASPPTAGSGSRCSARPRIERIGELDGVAAAGSRTSSRSQTALENSRQGPDLQHARARDAVPARRPARLDARRRRPRLRASRARRASSDHLYGWAEASAYATPFVADPAQALAGRRHDRLRRRASTPPRVAATLRANGIVDVEPYRKLGRNQLRDRHVPGDRPGRRRGAHRLHRLGRRARQTGGSVMTKVLVEEKIADSGVELLREQLRRRARPRLDARASCSSGSATSTGS